MRSPPGHWVLIERPKMNQRFNVYDKARQAYIEEYDIRFLRFTADDVENNLDAVIQRIAAII